jgi:glutamine cyclotransferase
MIGLTPALLLALTLSACNRCPLSPGDPEGEGQVTMEGEGSHEGAPEGEGSVEGVTEGEGEGVSEGAVEGVSEGEPEGDVTSGLPDCSPTCGYEVVNVYPHDRGAFTQGLVYYNGDLIEGTGYYAQSELRLVDLETGVIQRRYRLVDVPFCSDKNCFGEGVTYFADRIIQLTWQHERGFVYDLGSFTLVDDFTYEDMEGWGITHDGTQLIMSDGTANLYFLDPNTYEKRDSVVVTENGSPVRYLNELEYIEGEVFANIWREDRIVRIDPETGNVNGDIDLTGLLPPEDRPGSNVLNGITWDREGKRLFVTGKYWPKLFEITLKP